MSKSLPTTNAKTVTQQSPKPRSITLSEQWVDTVRLYVPLARRRIAEASLALGKAQLLAGGWTCRHVAGGWIAPSGQAIIEPVDEYEFLVPYDKAQAVRKYLIALSEELLVAGEQAVLMVVQHASGAVVTYTLS